MKSFYPFTFFETLNGFYADFKAFFSLLFFWHALHTLDHFIWNIHSRHTVFHIICHAGGLKGGYPCHNVALFMQAPFSCKPHPFFKFIQIVDTLGLNKLHSRSDFFCQSGDPDLKWICKGVGRSTHKHFRWALDVLSPEEFPFVPHVSDGLDQLHGIQIKNILSLRLIPKVLMVA